MANGRRGNGLSPVTILLSGLALLAIDFQLWAQVEAPPVNTPQVGMSLQMASERVGLGRYSSRFKIGFEIEVTESFLPPLLHWVDLDASEAAATLRGSLREADLQDYLVGGETLQSLPADLRTRLTEGLVLETPEIARTSKPENGAPKKDFPQPVHQNPMGFRAPGLQLILPELPKQATEAHNLVKRGLLFRPIQDDWEALSERWNALSVEEQKQTVQLNNLSPAVQARIVSETLSAFVSHPVPLKAGAPEAIRTAFEHTSWGTDYYMNGNGGIGGYGLELRTKTPYMDAQAYLTDVELLSSLLGRPLVNAAGFTGVGHHFHMSVPGRDLTKIAKALNEWLLMKAIETGFVKNTLDSNAQVAYKDVYRKGLLRLIRRPIDGKDPGTSYVADRIEFRFRPEKPRQALERYLRWFFMPEDEVLREIRGETKALLTPERFRIIAEKRPDIAMDLLDYVPEMSVATLFDVLDEKGVQTLIQHVAETGRADEALLKRLAAFLEKQPGDLSFGPHVSAAQDALIRLGNHDLTTRSRVHELLWPMLESDNPYALDVLWKTGADEARLSEATRRQLLEGPAYVGKMDDWIHRAVKTSPKDKRVIERLIDFLAQNRFGDDSSDWGRELFASYSNVHAARDALLEIAKADPATRDLIWKLLEPLYEKDNVHAAFILVETGFDKERLVAVARAKLRDSTIWYTPLQNTLSLLAKLDGLDVATIAFVIEKLRAEIGGDKSLMWRGVIENSPDLMKNETFASELRKLQAEFPDDYSLSRAVETGSEPKRAYVVLPAPAGERGGCGMLLSRMGWAR